MQLLKMTPLKRMASGVKFCALVTDGSITRTGFGVTEEEAKAKAESNVMKRKK